MLRFSSFGTRRPAFNQFFERFVGSSLWKIVRVHRAFPIKITHKKFVVTVRAEIRSGSGVDAGTTSAFHAGSIFKNRYLVVLRFHRRIVTSGLEQGPRPGPIAAMMRGALISP